MDEIVQIVSIRSNFTLSVLHLNGDLPELTVNSYKNYARRNSMQIEVIPFHLPPTISRTIVEKYFTEMLYHFGKEELGDLGQDF